MINVLVTGAEGQLGSSMLPALKTRFERQGVNPTVTDINTLDITDPHAVRDFFKRSKVDCILNCAAYTNVDRAEAEPDKAYGVNARGVQLLVAAAEACGAIVIHVSTDFVFDGTKRTPYKEDDVPNPLSTYGRSKLAGEREVLRYCQGIVVRTSWLYAPGHVNFVTRIIQLAREQGVLRVVTDQYGTPTHAGDLAEAISRLAEWAYRSRKHEVGGIFHYSNTGECSWHQFASAIVSLAGIRCRVHPVATAEYPTPATRPAYSVLDKTKIKAELSLEIPRWRDSLALSLKQI